jgi:hypothetical protein
MADPRYREFAWFVTSAGRQVVPDAYPWRLMGLSDEELTTRELRFESGPVIPPHLRPTVIGVVRAQERLVVEHWDWWLGLQELHDKVEWLEPVPEVESGPPTDRMAALREIDPRRHGAQGMLF